MVQQTACVDHLIGTRRGSLTPLSTHMVLGKMSLGGWVCFITTLSCCLVEHRHSLPRVLRGRFQFHRLIRVTLSLFKTKGTIVVEWNFNTAWVNFVVSWGIFRFHWLIHLRLASLNAEGTTVNGGF